MHSLFTVYINGMEEKTKCSGSKFADTTKLDGLRELWGRCCDASRVMDVLSEWVSTWQT